MFNTKFINFPTAVLLKQAGFKHKCDWCITKYNEDYVYDDDPSHPESHKKGDIKFYHLTYDPDNVNLYPFMPVNDAAFWIRETFGINIYTRLMHNEKGEFKWYAFAEKYNKHTDNNGNITWDYDTNVIQTFPESDDPDECVDYAIAEILINILSDERE